MDTTATNEIISNMFEGIPAAFWKAAKILIGWIPDIISSIGKSGAAFFWTIIKVLWDPYWPFILLILSSWIIWELATRNGGFHYNSQNGFSPKFNRVVGSGTYVFFQWIMSVAISKLLGRETYFHVWPYLLHLTVFLSTGLFLNLVGFWKYWKLPKF